MMTQKKPKKKSLPATPPNPFEARAQKKTKTKPLIVSDKLRTIAIAALLLVGISYIVFQAFIATLKPSLVLTGQKSGYATSSEIAYIEGEAAIEASVSVNDSPVIVSSDGTFRARVILSPGVNRFSVQAHSQLDRVNEIEYFIVYEAQ